MRRHAARLLYEDTWRERMISGDARARAALHDRASHAIALQTHTAEPYI